MALSVARELDACFCETVRRVDQLEGGMQRIDSQWQFCAGEKCSIALRLDQAIESLGRLGASVLQVVALDRCNGGENAGLGAFIWNEKITTMFREHVLVDAGPKRAESTEKGYAARLRSERVEIAQSCFCDMQHRNAD